MFILCGLFRPWKCAIDTPVLARSARGIPRFLAPPQLQLYYKDSAPLWENHQLQIMNPIVLTIFLALNIKSGLAAVAFGKAEEHPSMYLFNIA